MAQTNVAVRFYYKGTIVFQLDGFRCLEIPSVFARLIEICGIDEGESL